MSPVEAGLRRFLLLSAAASCVGIPLELLLAEHTESPIQLVPLGATGLGLVALLAAAVAPRRETLLALRVVGGLLAVVGVLGCWEHLEHNWGFAAEIQPTAGSAALLVAALTGANPLLAPGAVSLAGLLAVAATWRHPAA